MRDKKRRERPLVTEIMEGDPIPVEGGELVPIVRMTRYSRRQALVTEKRTAGQGRHFVSMRPVGILDRRGLEDQHVSIHDETQRTITLLLLVALMVPCIAALLIYVSRRFS